MSRDETLRALAAEMRNEDDYDCDYQRRVSLVLSDYADRIDAALAAPQGGVLWIVCERDGHPVSVGADEGEAWSRADDLTGLFRHQLVERGYTCAPRPTPDDRIGDVVDLITADDVKHACNVVGATVLNADMQARVLSALLRDRLVVREGA